MNIKILGNGGAINTGLSYNAFVINNTLLCETPPDIMLSIHKNSIDLSLINTIYISHLHGDHIFGLPFLISAALILDIKENKKSSFKIIGPQGLEKLSENLVGSAFGSSCFNWMKEFCTFCKINETSKPDLIKGFQTSVFKLDHSVTTYGFCLARKKNSMDFAYIADTRWCESVHTVLNKKPRFVLIALNGDDKDPEPVHISIKDIKQKAIPITKDKTQYFGTHLREEFTSTLSCLTCAKPGMEIKL